VNTIALLATYFFFNSELLNALWQLLYESTTVLLYFVFDSSLV